ncbi:MAG: PP2C family protein-serine/threonine phosphatase, partial [Acidobacteriaceae bacterium]|nr:PP2C family protein-serine/threonine phosphatase [Acidobacteriaceae bacterium]
MRASYRKARLLLSSRGLWPTTKVALIASYLLALDLLLFVVQKLLGTFARPWSEGLNGWVQFLSFAAVGLLAILVFRWTKAKLLWRLRNRLIVTYTFIGVVPVVLLVTLALGSFYLFAGQFATFIVTTGLNSEIKSVEAANTAIAHNFASELERSRNSSVFIDTIRQSNRSWPGRQVCMWLGDKLILNSSPASESSLAALPLYLKSGLDGVVRDHGRLYLRALEKITVNGQELSVLSSKPFDQHMLQTLAANLGQVTLYATGLRLLKADRGAQSNEGTTITVAKPEGQYVLDLSKLGPPTYSVGSVPSPVRSLDRQVTFPTTIFVMDWETGDTANPAAIVVQTRISRLYAQLFAALGYLAPAIEAFLLFVFIVFCLIEIVALIIGTRLTRTVTGAVAQLYDATKHINQADFSHRIAVKSHDQIATLANSFNSMTASLEQLIEEQKEKQRLENELVIAQEVQSQLFPKEISQLSTLEVHGFCRPARTVSGDYYDFLRLDSDRLVLAVGDISGKGISAALMMATIHSAVRAYSLQDIPALREPVAVGAVASSGAVVPSESLAEVSPAALLGLLNHQLYESTPREKYATLFLGIYHSATHRLNYSNGGHLAPIILAPDGAIRRLDCGGTVVGLFDHMSYEEASVPLRAGEIFIAYSDGVTEPENDFGEFGEKRLVDLV